ncbi:hypothetical protein [Accumulibacter sp.]|uniref:hypothetical protein n=1 Tax=Accumulibacter sp. TaxID=2053492 RepID=UPI001AD36AA3|nr:hypothetical protein [Accumulibacter sp.]MBN8512853.1 hypothetical protein [Accumulibacter sp.]MBO3702505.1 hypothetical protein [Accumulibacter sp.]
MKKILASTALIAGLLGSGSAFAIATVICPLTTGNTAAAAGAPIPNGTAGTHYMTRPIAAKCSANTNVAGEDGTSGAWYAVGANSVKGKTNFGGHTNGGAVAKNGDCAIPGGCTAAEAVTARGVANTAAAGSGT